MNKSSKNFLFELLNTPSPSGMEKDIQLKWMKYVKKYADKVETDIAGNAIAIINHIFEETFHNSPSSSEGKLLDIKRISHNEIARKIKCFIWFLRTTTQFNKYLSYYYLPQ